MKQSNQIRESVVRLYRDGYTEAEINRGKDRLSTIHKLGSEWTTLNQSKVNRWLNAAKEDDPDLEVWHVLNRRRWKPGVYNNWRPEGIIILPPFYDPLADTLYLGPGDGFIPTGGREPGNILRVGKTRDGHVRTRRGLPDSDAVGPYVAELASFDYSCREIVALWRGHATRNRRLDGTVRVKRLVEHMRNIQPKPMSYVTVSRILQKYSFEYAEGTEPYLDDAVGHLELPSAVNSKY